MDVSGFLGSFCKFLMVYDAILRWVFRTGMSVAWEIRTRARFQSVGQPVSLHYASSFSAFT